MSDDDAWDLYIGAVIACEIDGRTCSLRGPDAAALPAVPLFVLTAWNPSGTERDDSLNEEAERALERDLAAAGVTFWPASGSSRDGSWSEPGVAIAGFDRAQACAYGTKYGQLAVYELTDSEVRVVQCATGAVIREQPRSA